MESIVHNYPEGTFVDKEENIHVPKPLNDIKDEGINLTCICGHKDNRHADAVSWGDGKCELCDCSRFEEHSDTKDDHKEKTFFGLDVIENPDLEKEEWRLMTPLNNIKDEEQRCENECIVGTKLGSGETVPYKRLKCGESVGQGVTLYCGKCGAENKETPSESDAYKHPCGHTPHCFCGKCDPKPLKDTKDCEHRFTHNSVGECYCLECGDRKKEWDKTPLNDTKDEEQGWEKSSESDWERRMEDVLIKLTDELGYIQGKKEHLAAFMAAKGNIFVLIQEAEKRGREEGQGWNNPCKKCGYNNH